MPRLSKKKSYLKKSKRTNRKSLKGGANTTNAKRENGKPMPLDEFKRMFDTNYKLNEIYSLLLNINSKAGDDDDDEGNNVGEPVTTGNSP